MDLTEWPVLDILDFKAVEFDVTHWSDDTYTLMVNYYALDPEKPDENTGGMTICLQTASDSLDEMGIIISMMIEMGFFDQLEISARGTVWNEDGDQVKEINWNDITNSALADISESIDDLQEEENVSKEDLPDDPLHHRPIKTLQ